MANCLATPDTILACCLTCCYTLLYWYYGQAVAVNVSWNVISMGVVFPITVSIGMAFKRREEVERPFNFRCVEIPAASLIQLEIPQLCLCDPMPSFKALSLFATMLGNTKSLWGAIQTWEITWVKDKR